MHMSKKTYNILSLDGGGSWALIQVKCLQALYGNHASGHDILSRFDLVAGNSGGSLVIAALAANKKLDEVLKMFVDKSIRHKIFASYNTPWRIFYKLLGLGPKYSTEKKILALKELLKEIKDVSILDLPSRINSNDGKKPHFFIPAFDYNRKRAIFFRSDKESNGIPEVLASKLGKTGSGGTPNGTLLEAAHASSTAPVNYFNEPASLSNCPSCFWDGAVAGYNNPVLAATTEALINGIAANDIVVLSIGTGITTLPVGSPSQTFENPKLKLNLNFKQGLISDVKKMATAILDAPPDAASYIAFTMLNPTHASNPNGFDRFIRANPQQQPILDGSVWQCPKALKLAEFIKLADIEMDAIRQQDINLIEKFADLWIEGNIPNQPIRLDADLIPLIGQSSFNDISSLVSKYIP